MAHYDFFQNRQCEYFPCHENADPQTFSCIFCYCPLYALGEHCGGNFTYTKDGIKDCSNCLRPHKRECYEDITKKVGDVIKLVQKTKPGKNDLQLYIPRLEDLWFYQKMMSDPKTMSYNAGYNLEFAGYYRDTGCIDYPDEMLPEWHSHWVGNEPDRFYAYIQRTSDGVWIGDINFHYNPENDWWDMGIVIYAPYRGKGYAVPSLQLLLEHAFQVCGIDRLHNEFETTRDTAWAIHRKVGFQELTRNDGMLHLILTKEDYLAQNTHQM